jgi:hypothetical protein
VIKRLLPDGRFSGGGRRFGSGAIREYLPPEFFPITHEGELASRVYIALCRCREEQVLAVRLGPRALKRLALQEEEPTWE